MNASLKPRFCLAKSIATLLVGYFALDFHGFGAPRGQQVVSGKASFDMSGKNMSITASNGAIINYQSFNIGKGQMVTFIQPSSSSTVLNRVTGAAPTYIFGQLNANGQVYLVNSAGVFFENGSMINVGGLYAAAGHMSDQDFLSGKNLFTQLTGEVVNRGTILSGGDVGLFGATVANYGSITSQTGVVAMLAGSQVLIGEKGSNIYVGANPAVTAAANAKPGVRNAGTIQAARTVLAAGDMYGVAIMQSGTITSPDITLQGGKGGQVNVSGTLNASTHAPGQVGGKIKLLGDKIALRSANLDASGSAGGGEILVGGDTHGGNGVQTASTTSVDAGTTIKADALVSGNGGKVVVWSDVQTDFAGSISAKGAGLSGAGGSAEVSGKALLNFTGKVDLTAPSGEKGSLLLDPSQITIQAGGTDGTSSSGSNPVTITGATTTSILTVANLEAELALANIIVDATGGPGTAASPSITLAAASPVIWSSGNSLTLLAGSGGISIGSTITTGGANLFLTTLTGSIALNASINAGTGAVALSAPLGTISEAAGSITAGSLGLAATATPTISVTTTLSTIAIDLTGPGNAFSFTQAAPFSVGTVGGISGITTNNGVVSLTATSGDLTLSQNVNAGTAAVNLTSSSGAITESGGAVSGGLLTTSSSTGQTLNGANTATSFNASDSTSGNIALTDTAATLLVTGISETGNGSVTVNNTGALTTNAAVTSTGTGLITLQSTGTETIGANVTASSGPGGISLTSTGGSLALNGNINAGTGAVALSAATGTITQGGGDTITARSLGIAAIATPSISTTGTVSTIAVDLTGAGNAFSFTQAGSFSVGTVGSISGVMTNNGAVSLTATTGNLTTSQNINAGTASVTLSTTAGGSSISQNGTVTGGTVAYTTPTLNLGNNVTASSAIDFSGTPAIVLTGNVVLTGTGAKFASGSTLNAGGDGLTLDFSSTVTISGTTITSLTNPITYSNLGSIETEGTGATQLTGSITTSGSQTYDEPVTLIGLTSLNGSAVTFDSTVDGTFGLAVNASSVATFDGAVGGVTPLASLGVTAATIDLNGGIVETSGNQTYNGAVVLSAAALLTSAGGNITFGSTVNGAFGLIVNANSTATFDGAVGGGTALASLGVTATTIDLNGGIVKTSGDQTYNGMVVLGATAPLTSTGGNITFGSTVNGAFGLTVNANNTATFGGTVGVGTALASLGVTAATIDLNGGIVKTSGDQTYNGMVVLGATAPLTSTGGNITFDATVNGAFGLMVNANNTATFGGTVGVGTPLASLGVTAATIDLNGGIVKTSGDQTYNGMVVLGATAPLTSTGGNITFDATVNGAFGLMVNANNTATFGGTVGVGTPLASLGVTAATIDLNGGIVKTSGDQTYNGMVVLGAAAPLTSTGGNITFDATVNGAFGLMVNANNTATFGGTVGVGTALTSLGVTAATIDLNGGIVKTSGDQTYNGMVVLGAAAPLTSTGGNITFDATVNGAFGLMVNANNTATFGGTVGVGTALASLGVTAATIDLNGGIVKTSGDQTYNGMVVLGATAPLTSTGGNITFDATVNGAFALTLNANKTATFGGTVGVGTALTSLGVTAATIDLNGGIVKTSGDQTYNGMVVLGATAPLTSTGGNITFDATVNGAFALTVNANNTATFDGAVGGITPLASLGVTAATIDLNGGVVNTSGDQTYNGPVVLGIDGTLAATAGNITFDGTVNGAFGLSVTASGTATFDGAVGGSTPLTSFGVKAATIDLNGGIVKTSGDQTYNGAVVLGIDGTLTATVGNVTFDSTVVSNQAAGVSNLWALSVTAPGTTTFKGAVGATGFELGNLTIDPTGTAGGTTDLNGGSVLTKSDGTNAVSGHNGNQIYHDNVVLTADTTLTAVGAVAVKPNVTFDGTITSDQAAGVSNLWALSVTAPGTTTFKGAVGATGFELGNLTIDPAGTAGGTTDLNGGSVLTKSDGTTAVAVHNGNQTYNDDVVLSANTTLTAVLNGPVNPNVTFARTVNSSASNLSTLTVNAPGVTWFQGNVGTATNGQLGALTTDAAGATWLGNGALTVQAAGSAVTGSTMTVDTLSDGVVASMQTGNQTYNDAVVLKADTTINAVLNGAVNPNVTFGGTVTSDQTAGVSNLWTLVVNSPGTTTFGGAVGGLLTSDNVQLGSLITDAPGVTDINGGEVRTKADTRVVHPVTGLSHLTTGEQTYNDDVVLSANAALDAESTGAVNPNVTFVRTVNSSTNNLSTLTVNAPGVTWFEGNVGTAANGQLGALTTDAAGATWLGNGALTVQAAGSAATGSTMTVDTKSDGVVASMQTGNQTYNDAVVLKADTTTNAVLNGTVNPNVTFGKTVNSDQTAGVSNLWTLVVNSPGTTTFGGAVGGNLGDNVELGALTTDAAGLTDINGASVRTKSDGVLGSIRTGSQTYNDAVVLSASATLTAVAAAAPAPGVLPPNVIFQKTLDATVDGASGLAVNTPGITQFNGAIGGTNRLAYLTTDAGGSTQFNQGFPLPVIPLLFPTVHPAWVNVIGPVTINDPVSFNVPGSSSANPTVATDSGAQTYNGPATLEQGTLLTSVSGNIVFNNTITGPDSLVITAGGNAQLHGNVTIATLDAAGKQGIILGTPAGIAIQTTGTQTYRNDVTLIGLVTATSSTGKAITFDGRTDGSGGLIVRTTNGTATFVGAVGDITPLNLLTVNAANIIIADVNANNNVSLDATTLLQLKGSDYTAGGTLAFNPTARAAISGSASIVKATGDLTLTASTFKMGVQQKLIVDDGQLTIDAGSATVGDLAASVGMIWNINSLTIEGRPAGGFTNANRKDVGVSFVSPSITFNGAITGVAPGGIVTFGTLSGIVGGANNVFIVPGLSVRLQSDLANQFGHPGSLPGTFLQPLAGGLVTVLNSQVTVVVPPVLDLPSPFLFDTDSQINPALIAELRELGINAREATEEETISINIREGVFNQPENLIESDDDGYHVVVNRITNAEAKRVTKLYEQIGGQKAFAAMQEVLDKAITAYFADTNAETVDAVKLLSWLGQKNGSNADAAAGLAQLHQLAKLFNDIETMGLTDIEVSRSQKSIVGKIVLQQPLKPAELFQAVKSLQPSAPKKPTPTGKPPAQAFWEDAEPMKHGDS